MTVIYRLHACFIFMIVGIAAFAQSCPDSNHPHAIDLGLPSGNKWACCNVGTNKTLETGGYYAWAELEEKEIYSIANYNNSGCLSFIPPHLSERKIFIIMDKQAFGDDFDVAHIQWGDPWHMPSSDEYKELISNCKAKWTTINGVYGMTFTGKNGNRIFFPAGGKKIDLSLNSMGSYGYYWTDTQNDLKSAHYFYFYNEKAATFHGSISIGMLVRPIVKPSSK